MSPESGNSLSARELLRKVYERLTERYPHQEITLLQRALTEIANDSDWHRTRRGCMGYESVALFPFGAKTWAVGRGEACGSYPADPYNSDILALEISSEAEGKTPEQLAKELETAIQRSDYFRNSLLCSMADGSLFMTKKSHLGMKVLGLLKPEVGKFIAQKLETDSEVVHLDLRPVVKSPMLYREEFVDVIVQAIVRVLTEA